MIIICSTLFQIITSAATWLLNFQSKDGYFVENESSDTNNEASRNTKNRVALTAHVLIALEETAEVIQVNFFIMFSN